MDITSIGCAGLVALAAVGVIGGGVAAGIEMEYGTEHNVTFTVQGLDDQSTGKGHQYMIFAADGNTYVNTDAWLHGKTDSSNVWNDFMRAGAGAEWDCPIYGYRVSLLSSYPDILDGCKLLKQGTPIAVS